MNPTKPEFLKKRKGIIMKKILSLALLLISFGALGQAQQVSQNSLFSATGQSQGLSEFGGFTNHTINWTNTGSPASCTVQIETATTVGGSYSAVGAAQTCTSNGNYTVYGSTANFYRVNVTALSAAATLTVNYFGWQNFNVGTQFNGNTVQTYTFGTGTGAGTSMFVVQDTAANTGTGAVLQVTAGSGSAAGSAASTGVLTVNPGAQAAGSAPSNGGSALTVIGGAGGATNSGTTTAGVGGTINLTTGAGGAGNSTGLGGAGGGFVVAGGVGGANATAGSTGGAGGALSLTGGAGGGSITGGAGGTATVKGGAGANGSTAGGSGGNVILQGGAVGTGGTGVAGLVQIVDSADNTKKIAFNDSAATTATTTTFTNSPTVSNTLTLPNNTGGIPVAYSCGSTGTGNQTCTPTAANLLTKIYNGQSTLSTNAAVITFAQGGFTSVTSFFCIANDVTTRANPVQMVPASATTATITNTTGGSDVIQWVCIGQ